jgi:hypothetical protein
MEDVLLSGKQDQALYLAADEEEEASVKSSSRSKTEMAPSGKQGMHRVLFALSLIMGNISF